ncbi:MAG: hypothetical protein K8R87_01800 [Verrucomicrobia bacterium]|nr:hypothetical protein [Verrucomicrobiota bacterium]
MPTNRILLILLAGVTLLQGQTKPQIDPRVKALIEEVRELQQKQQSNEALKKLDEADVISPGSALIANIRGSIYTAPPLRDYVKARGCFELAERLTPDAFEPKFNQIELLYVEHKYAEAETAFAKLLVNFVKLREEVRHLIQFKIIICQLKQGKRAEAEKTSAAFTFMDNTPAYYFTKSAFAFQSSDAEGAQNWITKAGKIFKPQDNAVYIDTLIEAGWLKSVTAGDVTK